MSSPRRLGVGIIGAGEVFQVCHGPCMLMLSHLFKIESICDLSPKTVDFCAAKFHIPHQTTTPQDVIDNPAVELVFILTSDDSHAPLAIAALNSGKNVFIEKPVSLSLPSVDTILEAERKSSGRVFVGYMRRYAASYLEAFKREVATIPKILYARVRDFSGPNAKFVNESGTFQTKNSDYPASANEERNARLETLYREAFPNQGEITDEKRNYCRFLGSLASHDISLMRETLGFPQSIDSVSANHPFYTATMTFRNSKDGDNSTYTTTYESGIDEVPIFDAHLAVYGSKKRVTIRYASPYVKGLPIYVDVDEVNEFGEAQNRRILSSYEDTYTAELQKVYEAFVDGGGKGDSNIKTTLEDARKDVEIFDGMYKRWLGGGN